MLLLFGEDIMIIDGFKVYIRDCFGFIEVFCESKNKTHVFQVQGGTSHIIETINAIINFAKSYERTEKMKPLINKIEESDFLHIMNLSNRIKTISVERFHNEDIKQSMYNSLLERLKKQVELLLSYQYGEETKI